MINGGDGFADVWKRGHFGWEYKNDRANLDRTYQHPTLFSGAGRWRRDRPSNRLTTSPALKSRSRDTQTGGHIVTRPIVVHGHASRIGCELSR